MQTEDEAQACAEAACAEAEFRSCTLEDLVVARRHLEDLEIFVGQRSRLHPGLGWALVLRMLSCDLAQVKAALRERGHVSAAGPLLS